jgi:transposase
VREEIRKRAVRRVLAGESRRVVIEGLGFHRSRNYDWLKQYRRRGEAGLKTRPIPARPRKFDDAHRGTTWGVKGETPVVAKETRQRWVHGALFRLQCSTEKIEVAV